MVPPVSERRNNKYTSGFLTGVVAETVTER